MSKIIRTPNEATGGITLEEKAAMDAHAELWIKRALRTEPIEPKKIIPAIEGIYAAAGLKRPRVVIASSPIVMAAAYGASAAIWYNRSATDIATSIATRSATDIATSIATRSATSIATRIATDSATRIATRSATRIATDSATRSATDSEVDALIKDAMNACFDLAGAFGVECAKRWHSAHQGGNMWAAFECYLTAARDILCLDLPEHKDYAHWEQAAIHGGFRVMHPKFCIVSDFPEYIKMDENNEPHCETGPSHRWRDGVSLYFWHGVQVPGRWIESPESVDPSEILSVENVEQRAAGISILGMSKMLDKLEHKIVDSDVDPAHGDLIQVRLPGLPDPVFYLKAECPRNGKIMEAVNPSEMEELTVKAAQAWRVGLSVSEFNYPSVRTQELMNMTVFAQGEIYARRVETLPENLVPFDERNANGDWIISHSESGHHHLLGAEGVTVMERTKDVPAGMRILYAIVKKPVELFQDAAVPHGAHTVSEGYTEFRIAREYDPIMEQARRVAD